MRRNILFFILALTLCLVTASYFGAFYNNIIPQYDNSFLGLSKEAVVFVAGVPFSYMFLIPFVFELFGTENRRKWIAWALLPGVLFYLYDGVTLFYIPMLASVFGFILAKLINIIILKLKHPNSPMVIK
ncbi:MAG: hypothetical protein AAB350_02050 [Patescibacteria group bacterium]